jgi:conjugative transfer region protein (TIGR03750 family)
MSRNQDVKHDGTVTFLPHHLNRQPVVVRGLTADELWICAALSAAAGVALGIPLAWLASSVAIVPTVTVIAVAAGVFVGGSVLRRQKRRRPETWLYRQLQWRIAIHHPSLATYLDGRSLFTRSGDWTTRRGAR